MDKRRRTSINPVLGVAMAAIIVALANPGAALACAGWSPASGAGTALISAAGNTTHRHLRIGEH